MKLMKNRTINKQRGWVSIEFLMGIGISLILIAGVIYLINKVNNDRRANEETTTIALINEKVQSLYAHDPDYEDITNKVLIDANFLNPANVGKNNKIINAWKGTIDVTKGDNADIATFKITTSNIPSEQCVRVASSLRKQVVTLHVNGTKVVDTISDGEAVSGSAAQLAGACAAKKNAVIVFEMR